MSLVWPILAHLSAEPLVGLKLGSRRGRAARPRAFSRTPRGFEAGRYRVREAVKNAFSRTPRGFEAQSLRRWPDGRRPFSRTPRGFEATTHSQRASNTTAFQPNPSWV